MGIRDRLAGLAHKAASVINAVADIVDPADAPDPTSASKSASPAPNAGSSPTSAKEDTSTKHWEFPFFDRGDAFALNDALKIAIADGSFSDPAKRSAALELISKAQSRGEGRSELGFAVPDQPAVDDPKALYWDPFALVQQLGFRERPSALTYTTLQQMVWRVPIVQDILQTRINQVSSFATPQHYKFETGFRVKMRDPEAKPTPADKKFIKAMERMVSNCGVEMSDGRTRDNFEMFLRKIVRDSLTYDQANWEVIPGRDGRPAEWYAVDAATIRLADTARLYPDDNPERVRTVQIYDNVIIAEFTAKEMAFMVRNPRTDIRSYGYGTSELEMIASTITALLWAWHYNQNFFSQGSVAKGLLNLKGAIPEKQLRAFRRQWYQMVSGVENAWRTPIINAEEVQWHNMQSSNRDMEFSAWMDFLVKVICSCYVMDPIEINFKYGNQAQKSMFEGAQRAKSQESRERGLKPLLRAIGREIDRTIIWPINPEFTLEFVGLDSQTPKELADLMTQRVRTTYTIDEIRAENDQPPLPDGMGAIILDANWLNARQQILQQRQQEAQMAQQQAMSAQQAGASPGVDDLEGMLRQLEGKPPKGGTPGGAAGAGPSGPGPKQGGGTPPFGSKGSGNQKNFEHPKAGQPQSLPAQSAKEIRNELAGEGTSPIEASDRHIDLEKSSVITIDM